MINSKSLLSVVSEFLKALSQKRTYNIKENWYCIFGILWGIPIPVVTIGIDLYSSGSAVNVYNIITKVISHPIHFFFLSHPVIFGIIFGAMGTVRYNKNMEIKEFEKNLINKNEELNKANKKLLELDELKSNFLSMVSHELRTPLTTILGYISFLKTGKAGEMTKNQIESLNISEEEAVRLNHLIEELLDLSKIETGEFKVNLGCVDIVQVVNKATSSLQPLAANKGVVLENNFSEEPPLILADRERIFQVVTNLIENGIKFNKFGGKVCVSANGCSGNSKLRICISDTGVGIEQAQLDKIFDKFYQVDSISKRKYGGCGLGLAISKNIMELHNGRIWAESKIGTGSKFFIELTRYDKKISS